MSMLLASADGLWAMAKRYREETAWQAIRPTIVPLKGATVATPVLYPHTTDAAFEMIPTDRIVHSQHAANCSWDPPAAVLESLDLNADDEFANSNPRTTVTKMVCTSTTVGCISGLMCWSVYELAHRGDDDENIWCSSHPLDADSCIQHNYNILLPFAAQGVSAGDVLTIHSTVLIDRPRPLYDIQITIVHSHNPPEVIYQNKFSV
jgi:hypothetical protein